ncbi:MAG: DNA helicase [Pseudomonadota bacterium]
MTLSAPIHVLKSRAKRQARLQGMPLHKALDAVAHSEGFQSWSHLVFASHKSRSAEALQGKLTPGKMVLLGARPRQGKTMLGLELLARLAAQGRPAWFFSLDFHERGVASAFDRLGLTAQAKSVAVDTSDAINADHIVNRLASAPPQPVFVVDYLQLLDQRRSHPRLDAQIKALRAHVRASGATGIVLSQIDRAFELTEKAMPTADDIRMPNPVDLRDFDTHCFLNEGQLAIADAA